MFAVLAILFKAIFGETCRAWYNSSIPLFAKILKPLINWSNKTEIVSNLPSRFNNFQDIIVILDCTEIAVQSPKYFSCGIKLYSNYKGTFTIKCMIGISPDGLITFIGEPYGGRASGIIIFELSLSYQLLLKMSKNDALMVDKGLSIDTIYNKDKSN